MSVKIIRVKNGTIKPIPPFKTLEEEANFWDNHDVTEDITPKTHIGFHQANKTDKITVRFEPDQLQNLRQQASQMGIGPTTLIRMWVIDKLKHRKQL